MPLKIKKLCDKYNSSSMILNIDNSKTFTSHIAENILKASTEHQLSLKNVNRKLTFYNIFKTDTKKAAFLDRIKNPLHRSAIGKLRLGNHSLYIETRRHTLPKTLKHLRRLEPFSTLPSDALIRRIGTTTLYHVLAILRYQMKHELLLNKIQSLL